MTSALRDAQTQPSCPDCGCNNTHWRTDCGCIRGDCECSGVCDDPDPDWENGDTAWRPAKPNPQPTMDEFGETLAVWAGQTRRDWTHIRNTFKHRSAPRDTTTTEQGADMPIPIGLLIKAFTEDKKQAARDRFDQGFNWFDQLWGWPDAPRVDPQRVTDKLNEQKAAKETPAVTEQNTQQSKSRVRPPRPPGRRDPAQTDPTPLPNPNERNGLSWPRPRAKAPTSPKSSKS